MYGMSRKSISCAGLSSLMALLCGCDALSGLVGIFQPNLVTVELVNNSDFAVEGELFYGDEDDTIADVLEATGTKRLFAIAAGGQSTFSVNCNDLRAIMIGDADLQIIGGVGPETSTGVLRDGNDFGCGDRIIFTFDHSDLILDFDVTTSVQRSSQ